MVNDPKNIARYSVGPVAAGRRTDPRYEFSAIAEIVEEKSGTRMKTHVSDLGRRGCRLDTNTPFPLHTDAKVYISKGTASFEAKATVVSSSIGKGMGLLFTAVNQRHSLILAAWLAESLATSMLTSNRRKSQRILVRLPVRASGKNDLGLPFEELLPILRKLEIIQ